MPKILFTSFVLAAALFIGIEAWSQQPPTPPLPPTTLYGTPITLEQAKKVADAAEAEARKRNMNMAIAVVEPSGDLVYFRRMDGAQYAAIKVAEDKAISAAIFRRSTKEFLDRVLKGDVSPLSLRGAVASAGGIPILVNGKIIGAIGVSGGADDPIAQAGADAVK
jgi:glc operon protein GlcG